MSEVGYIEKKIRRKERLTLLLIIVLTLSVGYVVIRHISFFNLKEIIVTGNSKLLEEKIEILSGLEYDANVFTIDLKGVRENVNSHPFIKNSSVNIKIPNKIKINIEERVEKFLIETEGAFLYVDEDGYVLKSLIEKIEEYPSIKGVKVRVNKMGDRIELIDEEEEINLKPVEYSTENMHEFVEEETKEIVEEDKFDLNDLTQFLNEIITTTKDLESIDFETIDISDEKNIYMYLKSGEEVAFGGLDEVKYKLEFMKTIMHDLNSKGIKAKTIDFTKSKNPVVTKK